MQRLKLVSTLTELAHGFERGILSLRDVETQQRVLRLNSHSLGMGCALFQPSRDRQGRRLDRLPGTFTFDCAFDAALARRMEFVARVIAEGVAQ